MEGLESLGLESQLSSKSYITGIVVNVFIKYVLTYITSFVVASMIAVILRVDLFDFGCDPKFKCICTLRCLFQPILISSAFLFIGFSLAFLFLTKKQSLYLQKRQTLVLRSSGVLLGFIAFFHPLTTIIIIYSGFLITWLPLCFIYSLAVIQICKRKRLL